MVHYRYPSGRRVQRKNRRHLLLTAALVAISLSPATFYANFQARLASPPVEATAEAASPAPVQNPPKVAPTGGEAWTFTDPKLTLKREALDFAHNAPLATTFSPPSPPRIVASVAPPQPATAPDIAQPSQPSPEPKVAQLAQPIPLPVPRPAEFRIARAPETARPEPQKVASAAIAPAPVRSAPQQPPVPTNNPSFFEKLFGIKPATPPESALSYAALDNGTGSIAPGTNYNPAPVAGNGTAVYDIAAKVVILPNGERLEAHSGLGDKLDDPRFVHVRMRGPTPPGTYVLSEREALFHGVRALRLTPVGGNAAIYGRDGILAHTYMLGPNGDSNGCVSFRDYNRFLQAYLRGEVKRLVVVAGRGQDALPRMASTRG